MIEASGNKIDVAVFTPGNETEFGLRIGFNAHALAEAGVVIGVHDEHDPDAAAREIVRDLEEEGGEVADAYKSLVDSVGGDFMAGIVGQVTGATEPPISEEEYQEALARKEEAATALVDHTMGYHNYMRTNLAQAYGEDGEDVNEEAWLATWKKLKDILGGEHGTLLADTAAFFDALAREKFGPEFKHMEEDRGPAVQADTCARTFYAVMQDHVPRAIIGANRDEWTGYQ